MQRHASLRTVALVAALAAVSSSTRAAAQDSFGDSADDTSSPSPSSSSTESNGLASPVDAGEVDGLDPNRDRQYWFGALIRAQVIPDYLPAAFLDLSAGFDTPVNGGGGAYFNYRRDDFNIQIEAFYQGYGWNGFVRGQNKPPTETEYIESQLGVVFGNLLFGWAFPVNEWFAVELNFGIGFGGMVGNLYRTEAWVDPAGEWHPCVGFGNPAGGGFCDDLGQVERPGPGGRLDDTRVQGATLQRETGANPFYFGDGGVPPMFVTLDLPRVAFRFMPIPDMQIRAEMGFNVYGFSFGANAAYGFN